MLFFRYNSAAFVHGNINGFGDVSELADEHDLGSCAERREGSIPSVPTFTTCHCEEPRSGDVAISNLAVSTRLLLEDSQ